jgi:hypothetical protein
MDSVGVWQGDSCFLVYKVAGPKPDYRWKTLGRTGSRLWDLDVYHGCPK